MRSRSVPGWTLLAPSSVCPSQILSSVEGSWAGWPWLWSCRQRQNFGEVYSVCEPTLLCSWRWIWRKIGAEKERNVWENTCDVLRANIVVCKQWYLFYDRRFGKVESFIVTGYKVHGISLCKILANLNVFATLITYPKYLKTITNFNKFKYFKVANQRKIVITYSQYSYVWGLG